MVFQVGIEPMQVDAQPEENDNVEEDRYVVENTTLVNDCRKKQDSLPLVYCLKKVTSIRDRH